jgi:RNA polymerase sigma factor (sigma-70 family)
MVVSVAASEWKKAGGYVDYDEVIAEALLGLAKADHQFKKHKGAKFSTYAYIKVVGSAKDVIRREIANSKKHLLVDSQVLVNVSKQTRIETIIALREQFAIVLEVLRRELEPLHRDILIQFYLEEKSEQEIAKQLKCKAVAVSKIKRKALQAAKDAMKRRGHNAIVE